MYSSSCTPRARRTIATFAAFRTAAVTVCLALASAGCRTPHGGAQKPRLELSPADLDFSYALAHYSRGLMYESDLGVQAPRTIEEFRKALELDPGRHRLHTKIAVGYLQQGRTEDAIRTLEESCRRHPKSVEARTDLALACQLTGKEETAIRHYRKALALAPDESSLYLALSRLLFKAERDGEAFAVLRRGLKKSDAVRLQAFCYSLGARFLEERELPRAIECFLFVARHSPDKRGPVYGLVGEIYSAMGRKDEAVRYLTLATEEEEPRANAFIKLAEVYMGSDPARSLEILERGAERLPGNDAILFSIGYVYSNRKEFERAIEIFEGIAQATEQAGKKLVPGFYLHYGAACEQAGRIEKAEELFEKCIELYPETHQVLNYLAYMWADRNVNLEKALEYVTRALEAEPENGAYVDTLGWVYYRLGQFEQALTELKKAHDLMPADPTISEHVGDALAALDRIEEALTYWKKSLVSAPDNAAVREKLASHGVDPERVLEEAAAKETDEEEPEDEDGGPENGEHP